MPLSLQFAADHPYIAFLLSWPLLFLLLGVAWTVATLLTNAMNACVAVFSQLTSFVVILVRGYPEKGENEEDGSGNDKNDKPLAG